MGHAGYAEIMKKMLIEQETSITFNSAESDAVLWTCQSAMIRKMEKLGVVPFRKNGEGRAYHVPKKWVKVSKGRLGMTMSAERIAAMQAGRKSQSLRSELQ